MTNGTRQTNTFRKKADGLRNEQENIEKPK